MTIFTASTCREKISMTFPMSLSQKGLDHEIVEEFFLKELNLIKEGKPLLMYSLSHQKTVSFHADIYCVMNYHP
jgi:hypothetical protein